MGRSIEKLSIVAMLTDIAASIGAGHRRLTEESKTKFAGSLAVREADVSVEFEMQSKTIDQTPVLMMPTPIIAFGASSRLQRDDVGNRGKITLKIVNVFDTASTYGDADGKPNHQPGRGGRTGPKSDVALTLEEMKDSLRQAGLLLDKLAASKPEKDPPVEALGSFKDVAAKLGAMLREYKPVKKADKEQKIAVLRQLTAISRKLNEKSKAAEGIKALTSLFETNAKLIEKMLSERPGT